MPLPSIFVDADACPVKDEAVKVAARHGMVTTFVSNGGLRPSRDPMIRTVVVPKTPDAADDWIAGHIAANDIVVTADIPLASRVLEAGGHALGPTGRPFTQATIGMALAMRDLKQHLRETGASNGQGPAMSAADRSRFLSELDRIARLAANRSASDEAATA